MRFSWERDGIFVGSLSPADTQRGGKWNVGDDQIFQHADPGFSRFAKLKSWIARPDKYAPGKYPSKDRTDTEEQEFVLVMAGVLMARIAINKYPAVLTALPPQGFIEIPPDFVRSWELPKKVEIARGCTLLYRNHNMLRPALKFWDKATVIQVLRQPIKTDCRYIEIFEGKLSCGVRNGSVVLGRGDYLYMRRNAPISFESASGTISGIHLNYNQFRE